MTGRLTNLHSYEPGGRPAKLEEERQRACRPGALELLRKARELVDRGTAEPAHALSDVWDHRDPYGPIAVASVALDRALPRGSLLGDLSKNDLLAAFDKAIAALEAEAC